jgi:hypothetical protein
MNINAILSPSKEGREGDNFPIRPSPEVWRRGNQQTNPSTDTLRKLSPILLVSLSALLLAACSSGEDPATDDTVSTFNSGEEQAPVLRIDETFTIEQFETAGFKLNKEFDTDTVPLATNVYYGFANRRDIEIRKYVTHADAMSAGVESALAILGRSPASNSGGGIITSNNNRTSYHAYLVAGNVVMLCQTDITVCEDLVNATISGG